MFLCSYLHSISITQKHTKQYLHVSMLDHCHLSKIFLFHVEVDESNKKNELLRYSNPIKAITDVSFVQSGIYKALDV